MDSGRTAGNWCRGAAVAIAMLALAGAVEADGEDFNAMLLDIDRQLQAADYAGALSGAQRAAELLPDDGNPEVAVNLYVREAFALMALDEYNEARRKLFDGLEITADHQGEISPDYEITLRDLVLQFAMQALEYRHGNSAAKHVYKARAAAFGSDSLEAAAGRYKQAEWYFFSSQAARAAKHCEFAVEIIDAVAGPTSEQLYQPLMLMARSNISGNRKPDDIRAALERILDIEFANPVDGDNARSQALAQLGDMAVMFHDSAGSDDYYRRAWQARKSAMQGDVTATNASFREPVQLRMKMPDSPARSSRGAEYFGEGYVIFEFTVSADGTLTDVEIAESEPGNDFDVPGIRAMKKAKYRPRVVDGEPVATPGVLFKTTYTIDR